MNAGYGPVKVLDDVSFGVDEGETVALLGANGAGKTTTLRAICGMLKPHGKVTIRGKDVSGRATEQIVKLGVAHVPEGRGTFAPLTVEENLRLGAYTRNGKGPVERVFTLFPRLQERRTQRAGTLSGGEQQMLAIGRALMLQPKLMLLDEPSLGLAPNLTRELFKILRNDQGGRGHGDADRRAEREPGARVRRRRPRARDRPRSSLSGTADEVQQDESMRKAYLGY